MFRGWSKLSLTYVVVSSVVQYVHSELGPVHPFRKVAVRRADQACCGRLLIRAVETLARFDILEFRGGIYLAYGNSSDHEEIVWRQ